MSFDWTSAAANPPEPGTPGPGRRRRSAAPQRSPLLPGGERIGQPQPQAVAAARQSGTVGDAGPEVARQGRRAAEQRCGDDAAGGQAFAGAQPQPVGGQVDDLGGQGGGANEVEQVAGQPGGWSGAWQLARVGHGTGSGRGAGGS